MFHLHLHCSAVIAQRITAADVRGKNGFSQDGFDPLICPWGMAQMLGLGLHFHRLIHVLSVFHLSMCMRSDKKSRFIWESEDLDHFYALWVYALNKKF